MRMMFYVSLIQYGGAEHVMVNLANYFSLDGQEVMFVTYPIKGGEYPLDSRIKRIILDEESSHKPQKPNKKDSVEVTPNKKPSKLKESIKKFDEKHSNHIRNLYVGTRELPKRVVRRIRRRIRETIREKTRYPRRLIKRTRKLRECIKEQKPDIVISFMYNNDIPAFLSTRGLKCKNLVSVRSDPEKMNLSLSPGLNIWLAKHVYKHADGVVFQTEEARDWFGRNNDHTRIIFNLVAPGFYQVSPKKNNTAANIIAVGRFSEQKNHMMLMKAFANIADQIDNNLIIYGDGKLREQYEDFISKNGLQDRIFIPGITEDVPEALAESSLFILSSSYEGMPNVLMEAMAVGLPCIATDCPCGGPRTLDGGMESIDFVDVGDTDMLSERMLYVLEHEDYASKLANNAKKRSEYFKSDYIFAQWKEFVTAILNRN